MNNPLAICNEMFVDWSFARVCEFAAGLGYQGVEIAPFTLGQQPIDLGDAARSRLRETAQTFELKIVGLHWLLAKTEGLHLTSADGETRKKTAAYLGELARLCADLGGTVMVFGSPQQRSFPPNETHEQAEERALDVFERLAPSLESAGVVLALEPLGPQETNFIQTADAAVNLLAALESPFFQLHLDVKAMSTEPTPIATIIRRHAKWLAHFHANDPNLLGPGMGAVDYAEFWPTLKENYSGWLSVEVFDYRPGPEKIARESIAYLKKFNEKGD